MKRLLLILFGLIVLLPAQSADDALRKAIIAINNGNYTTATRILPYVTDWEFDVNYWLDYEHLDYFLDKYETMTSDDAQVNLLSYLIEGLLFVADDEYEQKQYDEAIEDYLLVKEFLESLNLQRTYFYGRTTRGAGLAYKEKNDYINAEKYISLTLISLKELGSLATEEGIIVLNDLAHIYIHNAAYDSAKKALLFSLKEGDKIWGKKNANYCTILSNLGLVYSEQGEYDTAELYLTDALELQKELEGENTEDYAMIANNLGCLYKDIGDYNRAEHYHKKALMIRKNVLGEFHPLYAMSLNNLGGVYAEKKEYVKAAEYYQQVIDVYKENNITKDDVYATALTNLGVHYDAIGEYVKAEELLKEALDINERIYGLIHPKCAITLNNLACANENLQKYTTAEQYYQISGNILKEVFGEKNQKYIEAINNLGSLYYISMKDYANAEMQYRKAAKLYKDKFLSSFDFMSEQQRELYWKRTEWRFQNLYPEFIYKDSSRNPKITTFAYDNELFCKGLLLSLSTLINNSILESGDTTLIKYWHRLAKIKEELNQLRERAPQSSRISVDEQLAYELEKIITSLSADYRDNIRQWQITWDSVRNALSPSQVAIEFFFAPLIDTDSIMYCALLLRSNSSRPELIPLFEEKEVQALLNIGNPNLINRTYTYNGSGNALAQHIWGKILPYVRQGETIFFAPAGMLHQMAIEALPFDQMRTMADVFNLVRLSSTREIVLNKKSLKHTTAALYGGVNYGNPKEPSPEKALTREGVTYLPGTKTEVEQISQMLQDNHLLVRLYTADRADEESFKALSGKHQNILHIATHGFYWAEDVAKNKDYFAKRRMMSIGHDMPVEHEIDPLNRCGLLLAGANTAWTGHVGELPQNTQDGILTAKEISLMDLRNADMVVLSACETGKGEVTGEGVFGLQRAFKQAGTQTIIMSLWPVSDEATQLLMSEFYRNWINLHQSKRQAFVNAQNQVRSEYILPVFWAGFIMLD